MTSGRLPTHGHSRPQSPEYRAWNNMITRCTRPSSNRFHLYGGRGIRVCDRWRKFENFLADVGLRPSPDRSLDRYPDPNGDYKPGNVRWATREQQQRNKSSIPKYEFNGERLSVAEWSERVNLKAGTIHWRLAHGWPIAEALTRSAA